MIVVNAPTLDRRDGGRARVQRVKAAAQQLGGGAGDRLGHLLLDLCAADRRAAADADQLAHALRQLALAVVGDRLAVEAMPVQHPDDEVTVVSHLCEPVVLVLLLACPRKEHAGWILATDRLAADRYLRVTIGALAGVGIQSQARVAVVVVVAGVTLARAAPFLRLSRPLDRHREAVANVHRLPAPVVAVLVATPVVTPSSSSSSSSSTRARRAVAPVVFPAQAGQLSRPIAASRGLAAEALPLVAMASPRRRAVAVAQLAALAGPHAVAAARRPGCHRRRHPAATAAAAQTAARLTAWLTARLATELFAARVPPHAAVVLGRGAPTMVVVAAPAHHLWRRGAVAGTRRPNAGQVVTPTAPSSTSTTERAPPRSVGGLGETPLRRALQEVRAVGAAAEAHRAPAWGPARQTTLPPTPVNTRTSPGPARESQATGAIVNRIHGVVGRSAEARALKGRAVTSEFW
jgi:hypothetical protein